MLILLFSDHGAPHSCVWKTNAKAFASNKTAALSAALPSFSLGMNAPIHFYGRQLIGRHRDWVGGVAKSPSPWFEMWEYQCLFPQLSEWSQAVSFSHNIVCSDETQPAFYVCTLGMWMAMVFFLFLCSLDSFRRYFFHVGIFVHWSFLLTWKREPLSGFAFMLPHSCSLALPRP